MQQNKYITFLISALIFVLFFIYFYFTSSVLPHGAGPDWKSNTDVTKFIYENRRLAVLPNDEKELHFTVYGGTRALRPPLSYIVSAVTAGVFSFTEEELHSLFRKGSAILCALAVALTFFALNLYFLSYRVGILGAAIIGLMPQFTFIASYNNDDSGAIFSATLMITVLVRLYRYGINNTNAALLGFAGGLVIISKMTAWLMLPLVIVFLMFFIRANGRSLLRYSAIAGLLFVLSGGWWIAMNVYNYGLDDPVQMKINSTVVAQHRRLPPDAGVGFAAQGIGFYDLLIRNYKDFLGATARSTIGNLDWLKLKVGPLQYVFYLTIILFAIFYYLFLMIHQGVKKLRHSSTSLSESKRFTFESILFLMIGFQLLVYTWTNINNDIQVQGKYLIPVFLSVLLLFFSGADRLFTLISEARHAKISPTTPDNNRLFDNPVFLLTGLLLILIVHWNAWLNYVIPFYQPPAHDIRLGNFKTIPLNEEFQQKSHNLEIQVTSSGIQYIAIGEDPKAILKSSICKNISPNSMILIVFYAEHADTLQFFLDEGAGFTNRNSVSARYIQGENRLLLPISSNNCRGLRFDPFTKSGSILLRKLQIAPMNIRIRRD